FLFKVVPEVLLGLAPLRAKPLVEQSAYLIQGLFPDGLIAELQHIFQKRNQGTELVFRQIGPGTELDRFLESVGAQGVCRQHDYGEAAICRDLEEIESPDAHDVEHDEIVRERYQFLSRSFKSESRANRDSRTVC